MAKHPATHEKPNYACYHGSSIVCSVFFYLLQIGLASRINLIIVRHVFKTCPKTNELMECVTTKTVHKI